MGKGATKEWGLLEDVPCNNDRFLNPANFRIFMLCFIQLLTHLTKSFFVETIPDIHKTI